MVRLREIGGTAFWGALGIAGLVAGLLLMLACTVAMALLLGVIGAALHALI